METPQTGPGGPRVRPRRFVVAAAAIVLFVQIFGVPHVRLWDGAYWSVTGRYGHGAGNRPVVRLIKPNRTPLDHASAGARRAWSSLTSRINNL